MVSDRGTSLLRFSGFVGPHILATSDTWHSIADLVWQGMTVPDACKELGHDFGEIYGQMSTDVSRYMVDVSMLAGCREEYLGASNDTH
jgi:hypothetical protein